VSDFRFGLELRRRRRARGLSLRALQGLVRYDFTYLGQVERGEKPGSVALAATCDVALDAQGRLLALFREEPSCTWWEGETKDITVVLIPDDDDEEMVPRRNLLVEVGGDNSRLKMVEPDPVGIATLRGLYHGKYSVDELASMSWRR
jgi:transcriptional regulator with XRE-family HTH domain